jgi:hypothetical protein
MSDRKRYGAGDYEQSNRLTPASPEPRSWKPFQPSETGPEARVKSDYGFDRVRAGRPAMRLERSFWSRTRDEVRSWFGDRNAEARRTADLELAHGVDWEARDPHDDDDDVVWHGDRNLPPPPR